MSRGIGSICAVLILTVSAARGDMPPEPDRGPPMATTAGLEFAIQSAEVRFPPGYIKTFPVAVLIGCTDGHPNCKLAKSRNLIGMEVLTVDGEYLRPENGMVRQIVDAFDRKSATKTVTLELHPRESEGVSIKISFARH
jgi:hypothetical protein